MTKPNRPHFSTRCVHAGQEPDPTTGAVMMPIYATSTFVQQSPGVNKGYDYARTKNPTRMAFERPVKDVMVTRLETISADAPIADLVPLFRKDYIAIVMDGDQFLGVATRLDLINYFRITP